MSKRRGFALTVLILLFSGAATAQITGGSGNVFGMLDPVAAAEIENSADFVIFIVLPFIGMYGLFWFLIRKALLLTEHNFGQNTGLGSTGELSDTGKKASSLMAAAMATLFIFAYGGLTVPFALIIGLLGGLFLLWQTLGVFRHGAVNVGGTNTNTGGNPVPDGGVEEMTETVNQMNQQVEELEEDIDTRESRHDPGSADYSAEELSTVADKLESEAEFIEEIQEVEASQIKDIAEKGNEFVSYKKKEYELLARFRELEKESRQVLQKFFPSEMEAAADYAQLYLEFLEDRSFSSRENRWRNWQSHTEKNRRLEQLDQRTGRFDGLPQALRSGDLEEEVEEVYTLIKRMNEIERDSSSDLKQHRQELSRLVREQKNALEAMKKFTYRVEKAFEEENTLKKLSRALDDTELQQKTSMDQKKLEKLQEKFGEIENQENTLIELEGRLEDIDRAEMERFGLEELREINERAHRHLGKWLVTRDLVLSRGTISEEEEIHDALNRIIDSFQTLSRRTREMVEYETSQRETGKEIGKLVDELEEVTEKLMKTLLNHQKY
ncbi:MAG: hypothetical protein ABEJ75_04285 [Candidatus Nanohaloarchaea archaeon]